ncbi:hypothetical protein LC609_16490 [Nostoc sp. XA013]|nr:hypothetical protein [Nostoc sp. XA013]
MVAQALRVVTAGIQIYAEFPISKTFCAMAYPPFLVAIALLILSKTRIS